MTDDEGKSYDLIASKFADIRNSFQTEQKYIDLFTSYLRPRAHILDVGCGSGTPVSSYLIYQDYKVTGLDSSEKLLKFAKKNCPTMEIIYGDMRTVEIKQQFDGIIEWWALFHVPKKDHALMISRFASWLKKGGFLEFTTGDTDCHLRTSEMLKQELNFYSLHPDAYEKALKENGLKLILKEYDQAEHLVWLAMKE
ncbi:class I SAM-dependent methyltransferase [Legionella beliardensis]|nr:class I SAM-dependent methyltransferase [Legionella beliardensis]